MVADAIDQAWLTLLKRDLVGLHPVDREGGLDDEDRVAGAIRDARKPEISRRREGFRWPRCLGERGSIPVEDLIVRPAVVGPAGQLIQRRHLVPELAIVR